MELRATKFEIVSEDGEFLSYAFFQDGDRYFSIARPTARGADGEEIESEVNDQSRQTTIDPKTCVLRRDRLDFEYGDTAARQIGGESSITVFFPAAILDDLRTTLAEIFRDRRMYRDLSAS